MKNPLFPGLVLPLRRYYTSLSRKSGAGQGRQLTHRTHRETRRKRRGAGFEISGQAAQGTTPLGGRSKPNLRPGGRAGEAQAGALGSTRGPSISYMEGPRTILGMASPIGVSDTQGAARACPDPVGHDGRGARRRRLRAGSAPGCAPRGRGDRGRLPRALLPRCTGRSTPLTRRRPTSGSTGGSTAACWLRRALAGSARQAPGPPARAGPRPGRLHVPASAARRALRHSGRLAVPAVGFLTTSTCTAAAAQGQRPPLHGLAGQRRRGGRRSGLPSPPSARWCPITPYAEDRADDRGTALVAAADTVVLVMAGSWGVGDVTGTARAIPGTPRGSAGRACGRGAARAAGVVAIGWTDQVRRLLATADVVVHNAGGLPPARGSLPGCR